MQSVCARLCSITSAEPGHKIGHSRKTTRICPTGGFFVKCLFVHAEVQKQLTPRGLSDRDRDYYIQRLWQMFDSNDPRDEAKSLGAMRILGKAFVSEKVENIQVETLKIAGINEGLARMLGEDADEAAQSGQSSFDAVRTQLSMEDENPDE